MELVPRLIREFRTTHPDARFQLIQNSGELVMDALHAGEVDLAISVPGLFERGSETWETLTNQELFATVPREDLRSYPFVMLKPNHTMV
jgi:LysR family transcriptional regulator, transcription activator of glutamate synthase operon